MATRLEKANEHRLRIVRYYASGWEFLIRMLIGLGIYFTIRIGFAALLMRRYELPYYLTHAPLELVMLILTALLLVLLPRNKDTRIHFITSLWMPAISIFILIGWVRFFIALFDGAHIQAFAGILPYTLPLSVLVILWLLNVRKKTARYLRRILLILLCLLWIAELPFTIRAVRQLDTAINHYSVFYHDLRKEHILPAQALPAGDPSGNITTILKLQQVDIDNYRLDPAVPKLDHLEYVEELEIVIPGIIPDLSVSYQELDFTNLHRIDYHYLYKYTTQRHILMRDFQFRGDGFFHAWTGSGEAIFLSNVVVRKK